LLDASASQRFRARYRPWGVLDLSQTRLGAFHLLAIVGNASQQVSPRRQQNKKGRPTSRLTDNLRGWLLYWNVDRPLIGQSGEPIKKTNARTLKKAAKRAGIDPARVNRDMLHHYMATRSCSAGVPVEREERAAWMGHTDPNHSTTQK
jgi:hypothetical protein